jgi:hypothetical protein
LIAVGEADAELCWDTAAKCSAEAAKRSEQNVELGLSQRMLENCERPAESVCKCRGMQLSKTIEPMALRLKASRRRK